MEVDKHMHGGVTVVALNGDLDSTTSERVYKVVSDLVPEHGGLLLDLSGTSYMSSAGLRVLLLVYRQARRGHLPLALVAVPEEVRAVMSATGFLDFLPVAGSIEDGVEALTG